MLWSLMTNKWNFRQLYDYQSVEKEIRIFTKVYTVKK